MDKKNIFFLEVGINHFGKVKEANKYLNYFLNSQFNYLTFMLQTEKFYKKYIKKINFHLPRSFYEKAIKLSHKKNKKIGIAVCDLKTFEPLSNLNFDFYKLLSVGINQFDLIGFLNKKNKSVFVSTGFNVTDSKIKKCLKTFKSKKKINLLHSPMTYNPNELNLNRIDDLRNKFKLPVGYSNHNNDKNTLNIVSVYKPSSVFVYCKSRKKNRVYPDDGHAFYLDELDAIIQNYAKYYLMSTKSKKIKKINIFANKFKF